VTIEIKLLSAPLQCILTEFVNGLKMLDVDVTLLYCMCGSEQVSKRVMFFNVCL